MAQNDHISAVAQVIEPFGSGWSLGSHSEREHCEQG
jgi:hypothetical protein